MNSFLLLLSLLFCSVAGFAASDENLLIILNKDIKFSELQKNIKNSQITLKTLNDQISPLESSVENNRYKLLNIKSQKNLKTNGLKSYEEQYLVISTELHQLELTFEENLSEVKRKQMEAKDLVNEIAELIKQIEDFQTRLDRVVQRETKLRYQYKSQLNNCDNDLGCNKEDIDYLQKIWQQELNSMKSIEAQIASLSSLIDDKNNTKDELLKEIAAKNYFIKRIENEIADKSKILSYSMNELEMLKEELNYIQKYESKMFSIYLENSTKLLSLNDEKRQIEMNLEVMISQRDKIFNEFRDEYSKVIKFALINAKNKSQSIIKEQIENVSTYVAEVIYLDHLKGDYTCEKNIQNLLKTNKENLMNNKYFIINDSDMKINGLANFHIEKEFFDNTSELLQDVYQLIYKESFKKFAAEYFNEQGSDLYNSLVNKHLLAKKTLMKNTLSGCKKMVDTI